MVVVPFIREFFEDGVHFPVLNESDARVVG